MAASKQTVQDAARVLVRELGHERALKVVRHLETEVGGNKSFTDTIQALRMELDAAEIIGGRR